MEELSGLESLQHGFTDYWKTRAVNLPEGAVQLSRVALNSLSAAGLPTPALEDWKYTNIVPAFRKGFSPAVSPGSIPPDLLLQVPQPAGPRLVFIDGFLAPALSQAGAGKGVRVCSLAEALRRPETAGLFGSSADLEEHPLAALNTAFFGDGAAVIIEEDVSAAPVQLIFAASSEAGRISFPRVLVCLGNRAKAEVTEYYLGGAGRTCRAAMSELFLGEAAKALHVRVLIEDRESVHLSRTAASIQAGARLHAGVVCIGGALVRNEVSARLLGEGADLELSGLTLNGGQQHTDNHTVIEHVSPSCTSREVYKGVYAEQAQGVFDGTIVVRPGAQKTNAYQSNRSLLLSREAGVNAKPQLKIWADDVKCSHGATIGQIDKDALFYLRSRGIGRTDAYYLLMQAFVGDVLSSLENETLKAALNDFVQARLQQLPMSYTGEN